ncbi:MAG: YjjI family glycine radical enzyme [Negativicutes bacterium]|jgi:YjjI family glycine radical enzyme
MSNDKFRAIINNPNLEYYRKREQLFLAAEASVPEITVGEVARNYIDNGVICGLFEGNAPYRPRYVLPDYEKFFRQGSEYLQLEAPKDIFDAINALLIIYRYVPSITLYPVYLGQIDELLEPFAVSVDDGVLCSLLRMFVINVSRTMPNSFVHYNIGPCATRVGRIILELERELKQSEPNLSMKVDDATPEDYLLSAVATALETGKPYLVNHERELQEWDEFYGIASCYNSLPRGGGSYTLVRVNLRKAALLAESVEDFLEIRLPDVMKALFEIMDKRVDYIINQAHFFEGSFLNNEGLISRERFTAMCGAFGLYQCVEHLSGGLKLGVDADALIIAEKILARMRALIDSHRNPNCFENRFMFHAQSGIGDDVLETAGARIKVGSEPELFEHIKVAAKMQHYFNGGVSDIFVFDRTAKNNCAGVLRIIRAAFKLGLKLFAFNSDESDLVRVSGYLVKRSDLDKARNQQVTLSDTAGLGQQAVDGQNLLNRKVRKLNDGE